MNPSEISLLERKCRRWVALALVSASVTVGVQAEAKAPPGREAAAKEVSDRGVIVLADDSAPQYRETLDGIRALLPDAPVFDVAAAGLPEKIAGAGVVLSIGRKAWKVSREVAPELPKVFSVLMALTPADVDASNTGVPLEPDPGRALADMRVLLPNLKRVGMAVNPRNCALWLAEAKAAAATQGVELTVIEVPDASGLKPALLKLAPSIEALWVPPDSRLYTKELSYFVVEFGSQRNLPVFAFAEGLTRAGALASHSPDFKEIGKKAAELSLAIAKKPRAQRQPVPPAVFSAGQLSVNQASAKALHIAVDPRLLTRDSVQ